MTGFFWGWYNKDAARGKRQKQNQIRFFIYRAFVLYFLDCSVKEVKKLNKFLKKSWQDFFKGDTIKTQQGKRQKNKTKKIKKNAWQTKTSII